MNLGGPELLIIVAIAVLVFGANWLPKAARNLGKAKVELDKTQKQFNETKQTVVDATGVKELDATLRKANKALNTSPQKLLKDAAKKSVTGTGAAAAAASVSDDDIEDAELVETVETVETTDAGESTSGSGDTNINLDFDNQ